MNDELLLSLLKSIELLNFKVDSFIVPPSQSDIIFCQWLFEYLEKYRKQFQKKSTYDFNVRRIEIYCVPYFKDIKLVDVSVDLLQSFFSLLKSSNTADKIHVIFHGAFLKAYQLEMIRKNVFDFIEVRKHKNKNRRALTYTEQQLLFNVIKDEKYIEIFFKMCVTGVRLSEAYSIKSDNIDFIHNVIYVDMDDTNTKTHKRLIPFLPDLHLSDKKPFLPSSPVATQSYFKRLFRRLNLPLCVHCFRHTFISVCNDVGFNLKWIQETAGHKEILTTLNTYTKLLDSGTSPIKEYLIKLKKSFE